MAQSSNACRVCVIKHLFHSLYNKRNEKTEVQTRSSWNKVCKDQHKAKSYDMDLFIKKYLKDKFWKTKIVWHSVHRWCANAASSFCRKMFFRFSNTFIKRRCSNLIIPGKHYIILPTWIYRRTSSIKFRSICISGNKECLFHSYKISSWSELTYFLTGTFSRVVSTSWP